MSEQDPCDRGNGVFYDPVIMVEIEPDDGRVNVMLPTAIWISAEQARRFAAALVRAADFLEPQS